MPTTRWSNLLTQLTERIWFRLALFTAGAVALALVAGWAGPALPDELRLDFGQDSVLGILQILATSMLAVTTFSLTAMISAYASASAGTTPRATQLLVADRTSQNALSSFLGSFVFAIVGIVALATDSFSEQSRTLLFFGTLVVIAVVVLTLLRWIDHLTGFGRMADVIDRVETAGTDAVLEFARAPYLGAVPAVPVPDAAVPVRAQAAGCVTGVSMDALSAAAAEYGARVHVAVLPGVTAGLGSVLAYVEGAEAERVDGAVDAVCKAFELKDHRTFKQDARLGFVALSEIGSKALSPSTHDPGSAIEALNALQRVATLLLTTEPEAELTHPSVYVPTIPLEDFLEDGFRPIARDGAALVEIGLRVQRVLGFLIEIADPDNAAVLRVVSARAAERAVAGLVNARDVELVTAAAAEAQRV
jgi:uncharacterized membrane protein